MTSDKEPLILLKDFSKEFGQINKNNNNIQIKKEKLYEEIDTLSCKKIDLTSINKRPFDCPGSEVEESKLEESVNINIQKRKKKPAPFKMKFPIMGKIKLSKNVEEERSESKLQNHKISNTEKNSSTPGKSIENISAGNKSQMKRRNHGVGGAGASFSELEKELYLKPLKIGWRRELVYRNVYTSNIRQGDIYYFAPSGKKLRSRVEIGRFLVSNSITDLTTENFSFSKSLVGAGEPYEFERSANMKSSINSPNNSSSVVGSATKVSLKPKSKPQLSGSIKQTNLKNKVIPNCNSLPADTSNVKPSVQRTSSNKRKRTSSLPPQNKSKFIKLRDRQSIHPPARYEVEEDSDDDEDDYKVSGQNSNSRPHTIKEDKDRPEEMIVEPDIYLDENLDENVRLNFPFGINETDDQTTADIPEISLKGPLLSNENLPPIAKKDDSKSNFPLIQLNFEDLYNEDEGGGGTDDPNENPLEISKNPSKIRVRPLNELCDTTTGIDTQPSSINPVIMNFNINPNVQSYYPTFNAGLPSIPAVPIQHHLPYNNNGSVPVFVSMPNYTNNNPVVRKNRLLRFPFRITPNSNNEKGTVPPFQNVVPNFVRVIAPITSNMIPNLGDGNTNFNNYSATLNTTSFGNPGRSRSFNHRPLLPRSTCTMQGKSYEFVIGSNNTPVLRQVSQNSVNDYS